MSVNPNTINQRSTTAHLYIKKTQRVAAVYYQNVTLPQRDKTFLVTCVLNVDSNQPVQSLRRSHEETLHQWQSKMRPVKIPITLRKHVYSNILKISPPKTKSFQINFLIFFHISAQNIHCGFSLEPPRRGGSNEYPQSMFFSRNKKNNIYLCKPQFYYVMRG